MFRIFFSVWDESMIEKRWGGDFEPLPPFEVPPPPFSSIVPRLELLSFDKTRPGAKSAFRWF